MGIDVAADRLDCVALADDGAFAGGRVFSAGELDVLRDWAAGADVIAIDAPAALSSAPHASDASLAPKFRAARCGEIALGREHGIWVPWASPTIRPSAGWIATGLELYARLGGTRTIEAFPHAAFRVLTRPARLAKKTSVAGRRQRIEVLRGFGLPDGIELWSHDSLDAAIAAVVAHDHRNGTATRVSCDHDGSAIWLPATGDPERILCQEDDQRRRRHAEGSDR